MGKNKKTVTMSDDNSKMKSVSYNLKDMTVLIQKEDEIGLPLIGIRNGDGKSMFFRIGKYWEDNDWKKVHTFVKRGCINRENVFTNKEGDILKFNKMNVKLTMYDRCCWLVLKEQSSRIDFSVEVGEYIFSDSEYRHTKGVKITPLEEKVNDVETIF